MAARSGVPVILERTHGRTLVIASAFVSLGCSAGAPASPRVGDVLGVAPAEDAGVDASLSAAPDPCADAGDRGEGAAFPDLYRDFFGPTGRASCSARPICHVPGGTGAQTSGYVCAPDQNGCWTSMTRSIVPDGGTAMPEDTTLYKALRKAPPTPGSGPMPRNSTFAFCPADLTRIRQWIASGAASD